MAENVLDSGPPSAKRPKLSRCPPPMGTHDLPDELISSNDSGLVNGGDLSQLHTSLGGGGPAGLGPGGGGGVGGMGLGLGLGGQDAVAKHKQLSELLRSGAPNATQQGHQGAMGSPGGSALWGNT
ncbi:hypothetical protein F7725_013918 [Dissostichus mawsoni]|uniref:Uncharacterized protein n=1 Tax=Dissostichus mawsoni TaxID=36200 RepID=A0A7J5YUV7_DISMA|nr:hypothetical protein F7725_013918 [Dissostichus mawsoni]